MLNQSPIDKARLIVSEYFNEHQLRRDVEPILLKDVRIMDFSQTSKNWKATLVTNIPDDIIYEVTYNASMGMTYLAVYKKADGLAIRDKRD